jgi:putative ABC transport system permease protein
VAGLLTQAVIVATFAFLVGEVITVGLGAILPARIPLELLPARAVTTWIGLVVAAAVGGAISLRRVARIDPVSAIGTGT